jgi:uncharacterized RDD family membrane protein YckC
MRYAGVGPRAAAAFIDVILAGIPIAIIVGDTYRQGGSAGVHLGNGGTLLWAVAMAAYYAVAERVWGTSIGKRILNLRVCDESGGRITGRASIVRNLMRFVDAFPYIVPYATGAIVMSHYDEERRLGDRLARTVVAYRD